MTDTQHNIRELSLIIAAVVFQLSSLALTVIVLRWLLPDQVGDV
jgi:hypothetical protein